MTQDDYVTFEQAKLLKEKGFPQEWYHQYVYPTGKYDADKFKEPDIGELYFGDAEECYWMDYHKWITAPTLSLVQKWLREEKHLTVYVQPYDCDNSVIRYESNIYAKWVARDLYNTYEEALSVGINKALALI